MVEFNITEALYKTGLKDNLFQDVLLYFFMTDVMLEKVFIPEYEMWWLNSEGPLTDRFHSLVLIIGIIHLRMTLMSWKVNNKDYCICL